MADNDAAADAITEIVRSLTRSPDTTVHASIAGGRKTMGFFLGYALSLYGRAQDRLSHVLVSEPFEGHPGFFYPTPYQSIIQVGRDKSRSVDCRNARVTLADIPFVRLRDGQPKRLLEGTTRFSESVAAAQRALLPARLLFRLDTGSLHAGDMEIRMQPAELAFYAMLARLAKTGEPPARWTDTQLPERFLREYASIVGPHAATLEQVEQRLASDDLKAWFEQRKSKCNRALSDALEYNSARPYLIQSYDTRPNTRHGIALPPESILFMKAPQ